MKKKSAVLRKLLKDPGPIVTPCAFDCVSARIVEMAGLPAVMHGGFNTSASLLGLPDVGIITMMEMITAARHMVEAVDIPVIADVDDGFGKNLNVMRTISEAIKSGIAGVYMEDQMLPKRCPSLGGGDVVTTEEMVGKLHAARRIAADEDPDFVIIARTHASLARNFEEGLERGVIYAQEGADLVCGGGRPAHLDKGYFLEPTIFANVRNDMKIAREEIFGPVVSVIPFEDEEDAIRIANDSSYGLFGGIYSADTSKALAMAKRLRTGGVMINNASNIVHKPSGGFKESGLGREGGRWGMQEFTEIQAITWKA